MKKQSIESIRSQADEILSFAEFAKFAGFLPQRIASAMIAENGYYTCVFGNKKLFITA